MAEHTPGKLVAGTHEDGGILFTEDLSFALADVNQEDAGEQTWEANAARLVACWNFCIGTDSEFLTGANLGRMLAGRPSAAATDAVKAYQAWLDAEGFDNPELDGMNDAMDRLAEALTGKPLRRESD